MERSAPAPHTCRFRSTRPRWRRAAKQSACQRRRSRLLRVQRSRRACGFACSPFGRAPPSSCSQLSPPRRSSSPISAFLIEAQSLSILFTDFSIFDRSAEPVAAAFHVPLALRFAHHGDAVRLSWDRNAPTVRQAGRGVLWIHDGAAQSKLDLDAQQLAEGSIEVELALS